MISTHCFKNQPLFILHVAEEPLNSNDPKLLSLFTLAQHQIWKVETGWVHANVIRIADEILLDDGKKATIFSWSLVLSTKAPKVGWIASNLEATGEINAKNHGYLIDFSNNHIVTPFDDYGRWENADVSYWAYHDRIYKLEVKNFYTYFVGELGVWIHE